MLYLCVHVHIYIYIYIYIYVLQVSAERAALGLFQIRAGAAQGHDGLLKDVFVP